MTVTAFPLVLQVDVEALGYLLTLCPADANVSGRLAEFGGTRVILTAKTRKEIETLLLEASHGTKAQGN